MIDTSVLIAMVDADDAHHPAAREAMQALRRAGEVFVVPAAAYAEFMTRPHVDGSDAVLRGDGMIDAIPAQIEPVTRAVGREAAAVRARFGKRVPLPDALTIATAIVLGADRILTADAGWPQQAVPIEVLGGG